MAPTIILPVQTVWLHPPLSVDTVPFRLDNRRFNALQRQTDRWTGRHTSSLLLSTTVSSQAVWVGSYPRERLRRRRKPISALTFVSVPLSWHTAGGHGGSLAASHIDYRKRHRGGGDLLLTLTDRQTDRWTDGALRLLDRQQINLIRGLTVRDWCVQKLLWMT